MADIMDAAQYQVDAAMDMLLAAHARRPKDAPAKFCADCDIELEPHRVEFGACVTCKQIREAMAAHRRKGV